MLQPGQINLEDPHFIEYSRLRSRVLDLRRAAAKARRISTYASYTDMPSNERIILANKAAYATAEHREACRKLTALENRMTRTGTQSDWR